MRDDDKHWLTLSDSEHTLQAQAGDVILLTGDVGCGKSVWLKYLAGLRELPNHISMSMDETVPVVRMQFDRWPSVWLGGTVEEELLFGLKACPKRQQLEGILLAWGLADIELYSEPQHLHRLQSIRLSLAAMSLAKPSLLLLDNPSASLSEDMAIALAEDIGTCFKSSNTIVVVASNRWHDWRTVVTQAWSVCAIDKLPRMNTQI